MKKILDLAVKGLVLVRPRGQRNGALRETGWNQGRLQLPLQRQACAPRAIACHPQECLSARRERALRVVHHAERPLYG